MLGVGFQDTRGRTIIAAVGLLLGVGSQDTWGETIIVDVGLLLGVESQDIMLLSSGHLKYKSHPMAYWAHMTFMLGVKYMEVCIPYFLQVYGDVYTLLFTSIWRCTYSTLPTFELWPPRWKQMLLTIKPTQNNKSEITILI